MTITKRLVKGSQLTVEEMDANLTEIELRPTSIALASSGGSALVGTIQSGTGAVARTVEDKLSDVISVKDFGAVLDGVTPDDTAFALWDAEVVARVAAGRKVRAVINSGNALLNSTLTLNANDAIYEFEGMITAGPLFNTGDYLLNIAGSRVNVYNPMLECSSNAAGIFPSGGSINVHNPVINHYIGNGINIAGSSGDTNIYNPRITEWSNTDPEFAVDANFIGTGIYFNRADCNVWGGFVRWTGRCFAFGPNSQTAWIRGCHPYNGRSGGGVPRVDPILIEQEVGAGGANFVDCYLDNGIIRTYSNTIRVRTCEFLCNPAAVSYTNQALIESYADGTTHPYKLDIDTRTIASLPVGYTTVAFLPFGANVWSGDYSSINIATRIQGNARVVANIIDIIANNTSTDPDHFILKPSSSFKRSIQIGAATPLVETVTATGRTFDGDVVVSGSFRSAGGLRTSTVGVGASTGGSSVLSASVTEWQNINTATIATYTVSLPSAPADATIISIGSAGTITALTVNSAGADTVRGAPTTLAADGFASWRYRAANTTWYRRG